MKIVWSPLAVERLEEISDHFAYDKPFAADRWMDAVFKKVHLLKSNPEMGRVVPEIGATSIREIVFGNYRIIYRHTRDLIKILTVRSFRQLLSVKDMNPEKG